ncbi:thioesterase family protein [Pseudoxanthomonas composti]|uniref:Thioesterase family protein n=1 Tax=Pseudoxanthomonas composti TaxID=2137479 RepID=A0A4Q1JT05_9GAMM|nr:thioesterase family protein [Pseudoxanthomonas composti]RXR02071.1 thioesterase family protein [Pseudoxanthomonas composti]
MHASYFQAVGPMRFLPTQAVSGAWNIQEQHIAPSMGLLAHLVEAHRDARRDDGLRIGRASYDILGKLAMDAFEVEIEIVRPGKTIELVEARLRQGGRVGLVLRAWLMAACDTRALAGCEAAPMPAWEDLPAWDMGDLWPGGFVRSVELRRHQAAPGAASYWARTPVPLLADTPVSSTARLLGLVDVANGSAVRVAPQRVAFPNLDLGAHLFRVPVGEWVGFQTSVAFGPEGMGLTHSVLHDIEGPLGMVSQCLTVRPGLQG